MNLTDTFVHTLYTLKSQPLPKEVKEEARKCLLDQVGVMFAGAKLLQGQLETYLDMFSGDDYPGVSCPAKASYPCIYLEPTYGLFLSLVMGRHPVPDPGGQ